MYDINILLDRHSAPDIARAYLDRREGVKCE